MTTERRPRTFDGWWGMEIAIRVVCNHVARVIPLAVVIGSFNRVGNAPRGSGVDVEGDPTSDLMLPAMPRGALPTRLNECAILNRGIC